ncbi:DNA invertase Pin-like site-specific DNA recombinase [Bradyrhizobium japonicum]
MKSELVTPSHLARKAVVYIRQSTPHQVVSNQESLRLQYALRQRARELGWREAAIDVIDADLGLSGASIAQRNGFKELVGRVGLSEVGLILSIDVTRLARNCTDWYPLLDICGLRGCLIADRDGVYDPGTPNGRLLLGLKGSISELELHTIRSRLTAGLLAKAERGELAVMLPIGLMRDPSGVVVKDPDMAVQGRLGLVFQLFLQLRSVAKVMRALNERDLELPRRDRYGDLCWTRATLAAVAAILKNPAYAGAFVYGRTRFRPPKRRGPCHKRLRGRWRSGGSSLKIDIQPISTGQFMKKSDPSSEITEPNTCASKPAARLAMASSCSTALPGAHDVAIRCTSATRAAANMYAITCVPRKVSQPANTSAPPISMQPLATHS